MQDHVFPAVFGLFLITFPLLWLGITALLMTLAGWSRMAERFPDRPEEPAILTLGMQSGRIGFGVQFRGALRLTACRSGLRIGVLRLFAPFHRPILVPWNQIEETRSKLFFQWESRLTLGKPEAGRLVIATSVWERLSAHRR